MIKVFKNIESHKGQGVVYEVDGVPKKLMIVGVCYSCRFMDDWMEHPTGFLLGKRLPPGTPRGGFVEKQPVLYENVPADKLYPNMTEYVREKLKNNNERLDYLDFEIRDAEETLEKCRKKLESLKLSTHQELHRYSEANADLNKPSSDLDAFTLWVSKRSKTIDSCVEFRHNTSESLEKLKAERDEILKDNRKLDRKRISREARDKYNKSKENGNG